MALNNNIKDYGIVKGVVKYAKSGLDYFIPIFERILTYLHVPHADSCCPSDSRRPVGRNAETDVLQYYDPETDAWVDIEAGDAPDPTTYPPNKVLFVGSDGLPTTQTDFQRDPTTGTVYLGANNLSVASGAYLNNGRGTVIADVNGMYLTLDIIGSGAVDTAKSFNFYNKSTNYLQMGSTGATTHYVHFLGASNVLTIDNLAGTGTRPVVASSTGIVGTVTGASGSFTSNDGKTITVTNGIITAIV